MNFIFYFFAVALGIIIGSFLNVVIFRLHTHRVSKGRSKCMHCGHKLSSVDLIPIVSFILLRGRCRYCKGRLSRQYPIVEALTGLVFGLVLCKVNLLFGILTLAGVVNFAFYAFIFSLLIVLAFYDIKHFILPWKVMRVFLLASFIFPVLYGFLTDGITIQNFVAGFVVAFPFWVLWHFSKGRLIGFGDIELMCGFGFLFGISGGFAATIMSFWIGALYIFLKIVFTGKLIKGKTQIPFGPFLVIACFLVFLFSLNMSSFVFAIN